jgi:hypothetical protein
VAVAVRLVVAARVYENDQLVEPFEIKIYPRAERLVCVFITAVPIIQLFAWVEGGGERVVYWYSIQ